MNLFTSVLCVHVVTAVLGFGQIIGTALLAAAIGDGPIAPPVLKTLRRLLRGTGMTLGLVLLSGVLVEWACGGLFHDHWWFRISFLLVLAIGAINGMAFRSLRRSDPGVMRRVGISAWITLALVGATATLMVLKP
jgi:hypothetical protein